ncbi:hypothetical protein [Rhodococcus triatomae]|uniref:hypothetical protein n=1 Tax=Rhodococcus triatomae TaxID=300028 RepID=UPI000AD66643|nr:hypothetical protein [Rhodococcus triatomae]
MPIRPAREVLSLPGHTVRPDEGTWSALEYAAHVRDPIRHLYDVTGRRHPR